MTWRDRRVGDLTHLINGYPFDSAMFASSGEVPLVRIRNILARDFETFVPREAVPPSAWVHDGDVVIGMDGDFNCTLWDRGPAALNQRVCVLRATPKCDSRFMAYALPPHLKTINDLTYSTTVKHLSSGQVKAIRLAAPDVAGQRVIADHLDIEVAKVDSLVAEQEGLVSVLQERRTALVARTLATGLDNSAVKRSGLDWIETVPTHWVVANIRRFAQMKTGHTPSRTNPEFWIGCDIPWFTLSDVWQLRSGKRKYLGETQTQISELGLANSAAELLPQGTVVLSRTASVGFAGIMPRPMATSQDFWNWVCGPRLMPEYLLWVFRAMREEFNALMTGSTHKTIYQPVAAAMRIPIPPVQEQGQIVRFLDAEAEKIDALIAEAQGVVEVAKERRTALIGAAVSGQIEVRGEVD